MGGGEGGKEGGGIASASSRGVAAAITPTGWRESLERTGAAGSPACSLPAPPCPPPPSGTAAARPAPSTPASRSASGRFPSRGTSVSAAGEGRGGGGFGSNPKWWWRCCGRGAVEGPFPSDSRGRQGGSG